MRGAVALDRCNIQLRGPVRGPGARRRRRGPKGLRAAGARRHPSPALTAARAQLQVRLVRFSATPRAAALTATDGRGPARSARP